MGLALGRRTTLRREKLLNFVIPGDLPSERAWPTVVGHLARSGEWVGGRFSVQNSAGRQTEDI